MKAIISKVFGFLKHFFLRLHVVMTLHIGKRSQEKDLSANEDSTNDEGGN